MEGYSRDEKLLIKVLNSRSEMEHFHQDFELVYILEGSMDMYQDEKVTHMEQEDILVINANKKHSYEASQDILFAKLLIDYSLICDIVNNMGIIFWCDSTKDENEHFNELRASIKQLLNHYLRTGGEVYNFRHISLCYQIMDILSVHFLVKASDQENMNEKDKYDQRILQINNYIRAHYSRQISLKDLSEKLYLSNAYLSRFFKKNYGMSFTEYLANIRLYHAVDELLYTDASVTRIANDNGFPSVAAFNKSFKAAYGETPSAMRKKSKRQDNTVQRKRESAEIERRMEELLFRETNPEVKDVHSDLIEAVHSVEYPEEVHKTWKRMINAGAAADLLRSEIQEHIILLKEYLDFEYVRFWNVFSKELLIDITNKDGQYNFSKLDYILDFLSEQGIKPHLDLGQKPRRVQKNIQSALLYEDIAPVFENLDQWIKVIDAMMWHLIQRYGHELVDTWRLEIWFNEKYLYDEQAYQGYYELFDRSYETIRRYSKGVAIGGCGLRGDDDIEQNRIFLNGWKEYGGCPDFLSAIVFGYIRGEENSDIYNKRNTDNANLLHRIRNLKHLMREVGMEHTQLYITEWNSTISDRNYINDSCYKGAFFVKNVLETYDKADELSYFAGSDRISEHYDSGALLHGGMGIVTKDGIFKPAGFALRFLNNLYPWCVGKGQNYMITTDRHDNYGIICHNQKGLNYNYYLINEGEIEKEKIWKCFDDNNMLQLKLKMTELTPGKYQMKVHRINEAGGSILDVWRELGYESRLSRDDINYFRRVCEPRLTIQQFEVEGRARSLDIELAANEIAFIWIRKTD